MTAIHLYYPLNILKPFGENIWIADGGEIRMAFPLGVKIPFRQPRDDRNRVFPPPQPHADSHRPN